MRTNLDFSTRQLADPTAGFQQNVHQLGTLFGQFQKNKLDAEDRAQRIKERQQDVDFRNQQALRAEEQFNKTFGLQEEQAKRQQQDQERKLLGEQRLGEYADRLSGGLARGEMSDIQAAKVNTDIDRMLSNGMTPEQVNTKLLSKEYAPNLTYTAPKSTADKLAYIKSAGFSSPDYDATKLLDYQSKLAAPFEQQLRDEERMANEWKLAKMREAGENARLGKRLAAEKANAKSDKFVPYTVTVGFDSAGNPTNNPSKMAHKSNIVVSRPDQEAAIQRQYGNAIQLGTVTDYVPDTTGAGKYKDVKSIYSSPELTALAGKAGGIDADRLMKPLGELQNRYKGILTPGELVNIGMTSATDRGIWGDTSVNMQLMKNQVRDAILDNPKNKDDFTTVDKAVTAIMNKYW